MQNVQIKLNIGQTAVCTHMCMHYSIFMQQASASDPQFTITLAIKYIQYIWKTMVFSVHTHEQ